MVRIEQDRSRVLAGIKRNADVVGSTMGPWGMNVTVDFGTGMATFKDGVSVSKLMAFDDVWENLGSALVSAACRRTVEEAGDGTTATAVLTAAFCQIPESGFAVEQKIRKAVDRALEMIHEMSVPVVAQDGTIDGTLLRSVATISANGREDLGEMIGGMAERLGVYGQISVEEGTKLEAEVLNGYSYPGKVLAHQFNNKPGRLEVEECMVVLINEEVDALNKIAPVLKSYNSLDKKMPLVIVVGGMSGQALSTLAGNIDRFRAGQSPNEIYVVSAPSFGEERHQMMEDLSAIAKCPVFNHMRGMELSRFGRKDFGKVDRVKVTGSRVFIFGDVPTPHIEELKEIPGSDKRLAMLTGGIGVIRVGGATEMEVANDRELVEDAVRAVYSAMDGGVVPGCGRCLELVAHEFIKDKNLDFMAKALMAPANRIWENKGEKYLGSGRDDQWIIYPPRTDMPMNLWDYGIVDPAKVVSSAVKNAASAAIQFLTTNNFLSYR